MTLLFILLLLLILVVPQYMLQRKQRAHLERLQTMRDSLTIGDVVVTGAGLHGEVRGLDEGTVDLQIGEGVVTTWEKEAVIRNLSAELAQQEAAAADAAALSADAAGAPEHDSDFDAASHPENDIEARELREEDNTVVDPIAEPGTDSNRTDPEAQR